MRKKAGLPQKGGKLYSSLAEVKYNEEGFAIDENEQIEIDPLTLEGISEDNIYLLEGKLYDKQMLAKMVTYCSDVHAHIVVPHTGLDMSAPEIARIKVSIISPPKPFYINVTLNDNSYFNLEHNLKKNHLMLVRDPDNVGHLVLKYLQNDTLANHFVFGLHLKSDVTEVSESRYYPAVSILKYQNPAKPHVVGGKKKRVVKKK